MKQYNISFVFPMFNESGKIEETVRRVSLLAQSICADYELVIVDDASTDGSANIISRLAASDQHIKLIRLAVNTKFGGALNQGLRSARKDIIVYTDSDLPVKEQDIKLALEYLDQADVVTACSLAVKDPRIRRVVMSKVYNFLVEMFFGLKLRDINSGLKIYKKEALCGLDFKSRSPFIDVEIFVEVIKRGFKIAQFGLIFELSQKNHSAISRPSVVVRTLRDMLVYKFLR